MCMWIFSFKIENVPWTVYFLDSPYSLLPNNLNCQYVIAAIKKFIVSTFSFILLCIQFLVYYFSNKLKWVSSFIFYRRFPDP